MCRIPLVLAVSILTACSGLVVQPGTSSKEVAATRMISCSPDATTLSPTMATLSLPTPTSNPITPASVPVPGTQPNEARAFKTTRFRLELTPLGEVKSVIDKATGVNYVDQRGSGILFPFASAVHENRSLYPMQMEVQGTKLVVKLDLDSEVIITLQVEESPDFLTFQIEDVQGPPVSSLRFVQIPLKLDRIKSIAKCGRGVGNDEFGVYLVPLNEQVTVYAGAG